MYCMNSDREKHSIKELSHEMDFAFDDMYGKFYA
jgi:hypothetical protein